MKLARGVAEGREEEEGGPELSGPGTGRTLARPPEKGLFLEPSLVAAAGLRAGGGEPDWLSPRVRPSESWGGGTVKMALRLTAKPPPPPPPTPCPGAPPEVEGATELREIETVPAPARAPPRLDPGRLCDTELLLKEGLATLPELLAASPSSWLTQVS